jgi:3-oxoacyl-[acyl-carrier-protein] synthase II
VKPRRVVITGIGVVAPNGIGKDAFWEALYHGRSGVRHITLFDTTGLPTDIAGQVPDFDPTLFMPERLVKERGRASHLGVAAARLALLDAGIPEPPKSELGIAVGMTFPAMDYFERHIRKLLRNGKYSEKDVQLLYTSASPNMVAMDISSVCGIKGPRVTIANACSSGTLAIMRAYEDIARGSYDCFIAGGVDACLTYLGYAGLIEGGFQVVAQGPPEAVSRPFDKFRMGGVASEGAAILVLEHLDHAVRRSATVYGELLGVGTNFGPSISTPESVSKGLARSMKLALRSARVAPCEVDYICAHGPSLPVVDHMETVAIKQVLGPSAYRTPISSIKSMIGNPMAASGPLQVAAALLCMQNSTICPTINLKHPDPVCDLDYVPEGPRKNSVKVAVVDSHGFDNIDVALVLSSAENGAA